MTPLERLKDMARDWGGEIREVRADRWSDEPQFSSCPFDDNLAVDYRRLRVLYRKVPALGAIPHEMGHVFASVVGPGRCDEWEFFGWEYLVAKRAGCVAEWMESTANYQIPDPDHRGSSEFGELTTVEQRRVIAERIRAAREGGLIKFGVPVSIRTRRRPV